MIFEQTDRDGRPQESLVDRLDTIITGVGTVSPGVSGRLLDDRVVAEGVTKEQLQDRVVGDIGGIFCRGPARPNRQRYQRALDRRAARTHFSMRPAAARDPANAGVIVFAIGTPKRRSPSNVCEQA